MTEACSRLEDSWRSRETERNRSQKKEMIPNCNRNKEPDEWRGLKWVLGFLERSYAHVRFYRDSTNYIYQKRLVLSLKKKTKSSYIIVRNTCGTGGKWYVFLQHTRFYISAGHRLIFLI